MQECRDEIERLNNMTPEQVLAEARKSPTNRGPSLSTRLVTDRSADFQGSAVHSDRSGRRMDHGSSKYMNSRQILPLFSFPRVFSRECHFCRLRDFARKTRFCHVASAAPPVELCD